MITVARIMLLVVAFLFYMCSMGAKDEKSRYFNLIAAVTATVFLLAAIKVV